jgi:hypothetical protein
LGERVFDGDRAAELLDILWRVVAADAGEAIGAIRHGLAPLAMERKLS